MNGKSGVMVGLWDGVVQPISFDKVLGTKKLLDFKLLKLAEVLI